MTNASALTNGPLSESFPHVAILQQALRDQGLSLAGRRVLDVGTGDGQALLGLEQIGAIAPLGIDPRHASSEQRQQAHNRLRHGDGQNLAFADASFDALTYFFSLHHHPEPDYAILEAARVLRPGGLACCAEPLAEGPLYDLERWIDDEAPVRAAAQAALDAALARPNSPWQQVTRLTYHHPETYSALNELLSEMLGVDPERAARAARHANELNAAFAAHPDGIFDQPYRLRVFQRR